VNESDLWPNKLKAKNDDIEVQSGDAFGTLLTDAPPRANAQGTPYEMELTGFWGETEVSVAV